MKTAALPTYVSVNLYATCDKCGRELPGNPWWGLRKSAQLEESPACKHDWRVHESR